ncbi:MAG TPA: hypothetical protein VF559_00485 [Caulobacteraceae bacterium]|jgi:hypothetical protein
MTDRLGRLVVSLHIPKTGGTSFAAVLERAFPGQVAYFYKAHNRRTHSLLRERGRALDPQVIDELEAAGVCVLHGHGAFSTYAPAVPEPGRYWTWLREPIDRVVSSYHYHRRRQEQPETAGRGPAKAEGVTLSEFARERANRNQQSRILAGAALESLGFVGVTERFDESLARLGLPSAALPKAKNVNRKRPEATPEERRLIAELNAEDMALYERALRLQEAS